MKPVKENGDNQPATLRLTSVPATDNKEDLIAPWKLDAGDAD
jgi:hypothetical protein